MPSADRQRISFTGVPAKRRSGPVVSSGSRSTMRGMICTRRDGSLGVAIGAPKT